MSMSKSTQAHSYDSLTASRGINRNADADADAAELEFKLALSQVRSQIPARPRSVTPTPISSARTPREVEDRNEYLENELKKVEDLLAEAHAERDELYYRVQALSKKFESDARRTASPPRAPHIIPTASTATATTTTVLRENAELRRRFDEERAEQQRRVEHANAAQARQLDMIDSLQLDVGHFRRKCDELEAKLAASEFADRSLDAAVAPAISPTRRRSIGSGSALSTVESTGPPLLTFGASERPTLSTNSRHEREKALSEQLDQANRVNARTQAELERLRTELAAARIALDRRDAEAVERERLLADAGTDAHARLTEAWRSVVTFRKTLHELRVQVERQLAAPRNELGKLRERLYAALAAFATNARVNEQRVAATHEREVRELRDSLERQLREARESFDHQLREVQAAAERQIAEARSARDVANNSRESTSPVIQPDAVRALALEAESLQRALRELAQMVLSAGANEQTTLGSLTDSTDDQLALALVDIGIPPAGSLVAAVSSSMGTSAGAEVVPLGSSRGAFAENTLNVVRQALQRRQARLANVARSAQANRSALLQARSQLDECEAERRVNEVRCLQLQSELDVARREASEAKAECDRQRKQIAEVRTERERADADRLNVQRAREQLERRVKDADARAKESRETLDRAEEELTRRRNESETVQRSMEARAKQLVEADERASRLKDELLMARDALRKCELDRDLLDTRRNALEDAVTAAERTRAESDATISRLRAELDHALGAAQKLAAANEHIAADKDALKSALVQLEAASTRLAEEKRRVDAELAAARDDCARLEQSRAALDADKQTLSAELAASRRDADALDDQMRKINREKVELLDKLTTAARQKAAATDELGRLRGELERLQAALHALLEEKAATVDQLEHAHVALRDLEMQLQHAEERGNALRDEKRSLENTLADAQDLMDQLENKRTTLEAQLRDSAEQRSQIERQAAADAAEADKRCADTLAIAREREQQTLADAQHHVQLARAQFDEDLRRAADAHAAEVDRLRSHVAELERVVDDWRARADAQTADAARNLQDAAARHDAERAELVREMLRVAQTREEQLLAAEHDKEQLRATLEREKANLADRLRTTEKERLALNAELERSRNDAAQRDAADKQRLGETQAELERLQAHLDAACAERQRHAEVVGSQLIAVQRECEAARLEQEALEQRARAAEQQRDAARRDVAELTRERAVTADALATLQRDAAETRAALAEADRERDMLTRSAEELRERVRNCEARRNEVVRAQQDTAVRAASAEQRVVSLTDELAAVRDAARAEEQRAAHAANDAAELRRTLKLTESEYARIAAESDDARALVAQRDRLVDELRRELTAARQRISDAETRAEAFRAELQTARTSGDEREAALNSRLTELSCELEQAAAAHRIADDAKLAALNRARELEQHTQALASELARLDAERQTLDATLARADRERRELEFKLAAVAASARRLFKHEELHEREAQRVSPANVEPDEIRSGLRQVAQALTAAERERAALAEALAQTQARLNERTRELDAAASRAQLAETRLAEIDNARRDEEARIAAVRNETLVERDKASRAERDIAAALERCSALDASNRQLSEQKNALAQRLDDAERANRELRAFAEELEQQVRFVEQLRSNLDNDLKRCELAICERDNEIRSLRARRERFNDSPPSHPDSAEFQQQAALVEHLAAQVRERDAALSTANETAQQLSLQLARSNAIVHELESRLTHAHTSELSMSNNAGVNEQLRAQLADTHAALSDTRTENRRLADRVVEMERDRAAFDQRATKDTDLLARVHAAESDRQAAIAKCESLEKRATVAELQRQRSEFERNTLAQRLERAEEQRERLKAQLATQTQAPQLDSLFEERARELLGAMRKLEDENAALVRRTRQLEATLRDAEHKYARRVVELVDEAPPSAVVPTPDAGDAREFAYRMRIRGLERQVGVLKEQLSDELTRRDPSAKHTRAQLDDEAQKLDMVMRRDAATTPTHARPPLGSKLSGSHSNLAARYLANLRARSRSPARDMSAKGGELGLDRRPISIMSNDADGSNRSTF